MSTQEKKGTCRIGTSGYQYDHWRNVFYPEDLPKKEWFSFYAQRFDTVEINNTFYNLPKAETFDNWKKAAPEGFRYVLKFSRYGSHIKRLKDPEASIGQFMDRARHLGDTLAAVLVQVPPKWKPAPDRLAAFFAAAPSDTRWAFEVRDPRWLTDDIFNILRDNNVALCIHDIIPDHPHVTTADWVYLRFHGDHYAGSYSDEELSGTAATIKEHLAEGRDVMTFFNNDAEGYAAKNAATLKDMVRAG